MAVCGNHTRRNLAYITGSRWYRCDFHVHGPRSEDYRAKDDTPEMWLRAAVDAGLDCVAITDHNSGEWIDELKAELERLRRDEGIQLVLFPGTEVTAEGGWHLLVLFDPSKDRDHVKSFLTEAGIPHEQQGSTDSQARGYLDVLRAAEDHNGVCILAHANDTKGLLLQGSGAHMKEIVRHAALHGIELRGFDDCGEHRDARMGGDPQKIADARQTYSERLRALEDYRHQRTDSFASVRFSDNSTGGGHNLNSIGRCSTWIMMSRPDKEGLRLALHDGDLCTAVYDSAQPDKNLFDHAIVESVSISDAYYAGRREPLAVQFSPWLTTIIGGRGSGKSTVLECLRIALHRGDELQNLGDDSSVRKAFEDFRRVRDRRGSAGEAGALRRGTTIKVLYRKDNTRYEIGWGSEDDARSSIQLIGIDGAKTPQVGDVSQRFPVSIYSQKQIYELALKPEALLGIIDQSPEVDRASWDRQWQERFREFETGQARIRQLRGSAEHIPNIEGQLSDIGVRVAYFDSAASRQTRMARQRARDQERDVEAMRGYLWAKVRLIEDTVPQMSSVPLPVDRWDGEGLEEAIRMAHHATVAGLEEVKSLLNGAAIAARAVASGFETALSNCDWAMYLESAEKAHAELAAALGEKEVRNAEEYEDLLERRRILQARLEELRGSQTELKRLEAEAEQLRTDLRTMRQQLTRRRLGFIAALADKLDTVRIEIDAMGDSGHWEATLRQSIGIPTEFQSTLSPDGGSSDDTSAVRAQSRNLIDMVYAPDIRSGDRADRVIYVQDLLANIHRGSAAGVLDGRFENKLRGQQPETIDRILCSFPEDRVSVSYRTDATSRQWKSIVTGSPGEKTATILAFLIAHGTEPLIIDQPEDDLDNSLIYGLIVNQIKASKRRRQLIVVTHNPNIPVNGDAELIVVMEAISGGIARGSAGGLQEPEIRKQICRIMEGGEDAFRRRYQRIMGSGSSVN